MATDEKEASKKKSPTKEKLAQIEATNAVARNKREARGALAQIERCTLIAPELYDELIKAIEARRDKEETP